MPTGEFYIIYRLKKDQHPKGTLNSYKKKQTIPREKVTTQNQSENQ